MSRAVAKSSGDRTPVTGGIDPPARLLRPISAGPASMPGDPLGKHILRLLTLHKDLAQRFPHLDLASMDDAAKRAFLDNLNGALGIK